MNYDLDHDELSVGAAAACAALDSRHPHTAAAVLDLIRPYTDRSAEPGRVGWWTDGKDLAESLDYCGWQITDLSTTAWVATHPTTRDQVDFTEGQVRAAPGGGRIHVQAMDDLGDSATPQPGT